MNGVTLVLTLLLGGSEVENTWEKLAQPSEMSVGDKRGKATISAPRSSGGANGLK